METIGQDCEDIIFDYVSQLEHVDKFSKSLDIIKNSVKVMVNINRALVYVTYGVDADERIIDVFNGTYLYNQSITLKDGFGKILIYR